MSDPKWFAVSVERCVLINSSNMTLFRDDFKKACDLFAFIDQYEREKSFKDGGERAFDYMKAAGNQAALSLYHFRCTLKAISSLIEQSVLLRKTCNKKNIETIISSLDQQIPHIDMIRHAVAHAGEQYNSAAKGSKSSIDPDHKGMKSRPVIWKTIDNMIYEDKFTVGRNGHLLTLELSVRTVEIIDLHINHINAELAVFYATTQQRL